MKEFELVYSAKNGFSKRPLPTPPSELKNLEVLIQIESVGVCGSDLHNINQYRGDELRIGHEWVGVVIEASTKSKFKKGDHVSSTAILGCGECRPCQHGASNDCESPLVLGSEKLGMLRTWVVLSDHHLIKMPELEASSNALLEVAAVGDEALFNLQAMNGIKGKLLIFGAGPVGLMTALAAKKQDYDYEIIEVLSERVVKAQELNLKASSLGVSLLDKANEKKFDLIIDCSGDNHGQSGAFKYLPFFCSKKCSVLFVGKYGRPQELNMEHFSNLTAKFHWMRGMKNISYAQTVENWKSSIQEISKSVVTHSFNSDQVNEAFEMAQKPKESLKVLINLQAK